MSSYATSGSSPSRANRSSVARTKPNSGSKENRQQISLFISLSQGYCTNTKDTYRRRWFVGGPLGAGTAQAEAEGTPPGGTGLLEVEGTDPLVAEGTDPEVVGTAMGGTLQTHETMSDSCWPSWMLFIEKIATLMAKMSSLQRVCTQILLSPLRSVGFLA